MDTKIKYRNLCKAELTIPLWNKGWWLDAVCGDAWDVLIVEKGGEIVSALPYLITRGRFGLKQIVMPKLTQTLGLWIKYPKGQKYAKKLSYEKEICYLIIDQIESLGVSFFEQHFSYYFTNSLPFQWRGYQQTPWYTYIIEDLNNLNNIYDNFEAGKRNSIRKAEKKLTIKYDLPPNIFYEHLRTVLLKRGENINYSLELFQNIYHAAYNHCAGKAIYCQDSEERIHAALLLVWDNNCAYYLICSVDNDLRSGGGGDLLVWEAIKYSSQIVKSFDFEGSVVESLETAYRNFGGIQKPYFCISKTFSPKLMIHDGVNHVIGGLKKSIKNMMRRTKLK